MLFIYVRIKWLIYMCNSRMCGRCSCRRRVDVHTKSNKQTNVCMYTTIVGCWKYLPRFDLGSDFVITTTATTKWCMYVVSYIHTYRCNKQCKCMKTLRSKVTLNHENRWRFKSITMIEKWIMMMTLSQQSHSAVVQCVHVCMCVFVSRSLPDQLFTASGTRIIVLHFCFAFRCSKRLSSFSLSFNISLHQLQNKYLR